MGPLAQIADQTDDRTIDSAIERTHLLILWHDRHGNPEHLFRVLLSIGVEPTHALSLAHQVEQSGHAVLYRGSLYRCGVGRFILGWLGLRTSIMPEPS